MNFEFSEEQVMLRDSVARFLRQVDLPLRATSPKALIVPHHEFVAAMAVMGEVNRVTMKEFLF